MLSRALFIALVPVPGPLPVPILIIPKRAQQSDILPSPQSPNFHLQYDKPAKFPVFKQYTLLDW
jgi:hypothetical protein